VKKNNCFPYKFNISFLFVALFCRFSRAAYFLKRSILTAVNSSLVRLDPPLCDAALDRGEYVETLTWEELQSRILTRMTRGYEITRSTGVRPEVRKGAPEQIRLDVVQRGANKKVSGFINLEMC